MIGRPPDSSTHKSKAALLFIRSQVSSKIEGHIMFYSVCQNQFQESGPLGEVALPIFAEIIFGIRSRSQGSGAHASADSENFVHLEDDRSAFVLRELSLGIFQVPNHRSEKLLRFGQMRRGKRKTKSRKLKPQRTERLRTADWGTADHCQKLNGSF